MSFKRVTVFSTPEDIILHAVGSFAWDVEDDSPCNQNNSFMDSFNLESLGIDPSFRSGFVAVVGKPNAGKSTLINRIVGQKVSIVSSKPQTTRHRVLGIKTGDGYQVVFVDTPGIHKPNHELGRFMEKVYSSEMKDAEMVLFLTDCTHPPTDEDCRARDMLFGSQRLACPVLLVINKIDKTTDEKRDTFRQEVASWGDFSRIFEISALEGTGVPELTEEIKSMLPSGPPYFPDDVKSDQSIQFKAAEIVREKILALTRQEIPHSVFVHTEEVREGETPGVEYFRIIVYVEKKSQKGIIIGKAGGLLKKVGSLARKELESLTGHKVYLDLWVKVKEDWKDRKDLLKSWGYII